MDCVGEIGENYVCCDYRSLRLRTEIYSGTSIKKYLYEMTGFYDDPMDEKGNYHYGHFDDYYSDSKRVAYFVYNDDVLVGFAMLCPYSNIGQDPDYTMAEFTIFPSFRRKHFTLDVVQSEGTTL